MKRLGFYVFVCITVVMLFGFLGKETASAQTTLSASEYQSRGYALFDEQIKTLQDNRNTPASTPIVIDALIEAITKAKDVFGSSIDLNSTEPSKNYAVAISLSVDSIKESQKADRVNLGTPYVGSLIGGTGGTGVGVFINRLLQSGRADISNLGLSGEDRAELNADVDQHGSAAVVTTTKNIVDTSTCGLSSFNGLIACVSGLVEWLIKTIILNIAGFLVWLAANMFNLAMQSGVLHFSDWAPDALYPIWIVVRQIISLCVVFAGLYLGFMYIIGREGAFEKYIPWVIMFALFVNFSYPITRSLIDISNIVSLNIYSSALGTEALTGSDPNNSAGAIIMNRLGLQGLVFSATQVDTTAGNIVGSINSVPAALLAVVFVAYAAFVLFKATWIILGRTIALVFIIIASPLLFVDSVIPKLGEEAMKLRKVFFEQLAVAPVFMLMLALTLKFLDVFQTAKVLGDVNALTLVSNGGIGSVATFFNIAMMLIMLHIMLKVTTSISGSVGQMATNAVGKVGGFGLNAASLGTGMLARQTLGRVATGVMKGEGAMGKWVNTNQDSFLGRRAYNLSSALSKSTYDARNSGIVSGIAKTAGMGMGTGTKTNFADSRAFKEKDLRDRYGRIETRNIDGTVNKEGVEAKRRFAGTLGDKMGREFKEEEFKKEKANERRFDTYALKEDKKRKEMYVNEEDNKVKEKMLGFEQEKAQKENTEMNQGATSQAQVAQTSFNPQTSTPSWVGQNTDVPAKDRKEAFEKEKAQNGEKQEMFTTDYQTLLTSLNQEISKQEKGEDSRTTSPTNNTPSSNKESGKLAV